jgi:6-phospho-3-hexuloisomerase
MERICQIPYIDKIYKNVMEVDENELLSFYSDLLCSDCIVILGSGRSRYAASIPLSQIAMTTDKIVIEPDDIGFPGGNLYNAAKKLEERYEKISIVVNSGRGESLVPRIHAKEIVEYIEKTGNRNFTIDVITSNPSSPLGKIGSKYGHLIMLKGREEVKKSQSYEERGIMGDMFELGSCYLLQSLAIGLFREDVNEIFNYMNNELPKIGEKIDESEEIYNSVIDILERRCSVFGSAKGTGEKVINMTLIRLHHVKRALGDMVYRARGINTPRPRKGDIQISVSASGRTEAVLEWTRTVKKVGGYQFSIIGDKNSPLGKLSDFVIELDSDEEPGPRNFYVRAAFVLSPLPLKLIERLDEKGLKLPEYLLEYYHSAIE